MVKLQDRRVLIASLFLPVTVTEQDEPSHEISENIPRAQELEPRPTHANKKPSLGSRTLTGPITSILDDLAGKSKVATPISTPMKETSNPFLSFASINDALNQVGSVTRAAAAPVVSAVSSVIGTTATRSANLPSPPRARAPQRSGSRSSSVSRFARSPSTLGSLVFSTNPHANGGLQNALKSAEGTFQRQICIGVLGNATDAFTADLRSSIDRKLKAAHDSIAVWVPDAEFSGCYDGFCHQVLWPTLHYAVPDAPKTKSFYESSTYSQYLAVNQKFADAIVAAYQPGDIVWVNDYHLMLVPRLVREKLPQAIIGFFLHVAWPSSEIFRCLAVRKDLLWGILGADLVGTQTHNFARHFRNCASRILSLEAVPKGVQLENRFVDVAVFPMGIDVERLTQKRKEPEVAEWVHVLKQRFPGMTLIVGRDKLDEVQGVRQKILAFEKFLERHAEYRGKVVLIQVALSTSEENEFHGHVADVVSRVNSRFASLTYQPIVFLHTHELTFSQYLGLLTVADAFIITSLREGMALRAHEYVECQEGKAGPLVLSEFTGSYSFSGFRSCIPCNPWDTIATSEAIYQALTMPAEEALTRWKDLHAHVITQTAQSFVESFVSRCISVHAEHQLQPLASIPQLKLGDLLPSYASAKKRLIQLDLEGCTWDRDPHARSYAIPRETVDAIARLASDPKNDVWLLSGFSRAVLQQGLGELFDHVGVGAENGCFYKPPHTEGKADAWISLVDDLDDSWKPAAIEILNYFTERTPGSFVEESEASVTWRFSSDAQEIATEREWARRQAAEAQNHLWDSLGERFSLRIIPRSNSFIVLPNKISRTTAMGVFLRMYGITKFRAAPASHPEETVEVPLKSNVDLVFAISRDDRMLARLNNVSNAITCSSSGKPSDAQWRLGGPKEVLSFVTALGNTLDAPPVA
ncbi:hypothetical protein EXIGLDRAFT_673899 [Exidia glandulosa HHB12029]|uniref:Uncharacterized protein n=1 Tax=Exidia glandulosa HHB12029 TaxID=1314781 RepID=A0A165IP64_EXIGL|nr:hypothetical protein EXIGLDRAFT_673899 [Exidia glandulosa HHB12029]